MVLKSKKRQLSRDISSQTVPNNPIVKFQSFSWCERSPPSLFRSVEETGPNRFVL